MARRRAPTGDPFAWARTHATLLLDRVRTGAYRRAIDAGVARDDVVADLGCGSGILSIFAVRAGAGRVHAIDRAAILEVARETATRNHVADRIVFHEADIANVVLPERVDVLIHELFGGFVFDEGVVPLLRSARERLLKPGGRMVPAGLTLVAAPSDVTTDLARDVRRLEACPYGVDLRSVAARLLCERARDACLPSSLHLENRESCLAPPQPFLTLDLASGGSGLPKAADLSFRIVRPGVLRALLVWSEIDLGAGVRLSTAPRRVGTHWGQICLPVFRPVRVAKGDLVFASIEPAERPERWTFAWSRS